MSNCWRSVSKARVRFLHRLSRPDGRIGEGGRGGGWMSDIAMARTLPTAPSPVTTHWKNRGSEQQSAQEQETKFVKQARCAGADLEGLDAGLSHCEAAMERMRS